jgi:hypothetical protein
MVFDGGFFCRSDPGDCQETRQKLLHPCDEQVQIVAGCGENGVEGVTFGSLEMVLFQQAVALDPT